MIKKFKEYIEESVFDDIISRSKGKETRREDDINLLDRNGMCNYILDNYTLLDKTHLIENTTLGLMIPITKSIYLNISYYTTPYKEQEKSVKSIWISPGGRSKLPIELFNYLRDTYNVTGGLSGIMLNSEHKEITNTMCVDILDNLLKYIPKTILVKNIKEYIEESVFDDIIARSKGKETRREDSIDLFNRDEMYDYIMDNYDYTMDHPDIYGSTSSPNSDMSYFSIPIFKYDFYDYASKFYRLNVSYKNGKINEITIQADSSNCKEFWKAMIDKFYLTQSDDRGIRVRTKQGKTTNTLCIELIDTIIENSKVPILKKRTK